MSDAIIINTQLQIPLAELQYRFVRSSGPGGQHVNKSATQVELLFDVARSPSLDEAQRRRIMSKLKNLIDGDGVLHLSAQSERSQLRNREEVTARFQQLLAQAVRVPRKRKPTRPTKASKEKRLALKKKRGEVKKFRRKVIDE